jgi:2-octaprenyl-6-methoxyphenol hydroxylase
MALALALRLHGVSAEIFEARERPAVRNDHRVLALSEGSRQILDWLGAWSGLSATAIETIHISQRGGFGRTLLRASELGLGALGWVLPARDLIVALDAAATNAGIVYRDSARVGAGVTMASMRCCAMSPSMGRIAMLPGSASPAKARWRCCRWVKAIRWC